MEGQAEVRLAALHPSQAVLGCERCVASGVSLCGREGGSHGATRGAEKLEEPPGTPARPRWRRWEESCRGAESPAGQRVPAPPRSGCWCRLAAGRWPLLLQGCSLSAAWFLQDVPKQGPAPAPSGHGGGLCRLPGEFWSEKQGGPPFLLQPARLQNRGCCCCCPSPRGSRCPSRCSGRELSPRDPATVLSARGAACLSSVPRAGWMGPRSSARAGRSCAHLSLECRQAGVAAQGRTSPGGARTPAGQRPLDVVLWGHGASAAAHSVKEGRARAGPGCPGGTPALRSLRAGATELEPRFQLPPPCPSCRTALQAGQGRTGQGTTGQGRLRERWPGGLR